MSHFSSLFFLLILMSAQLTAQTRSNTFGIQLGNQVSLPAVGNAEEFDGQLLLRYSFGFLGRTILNDHLKLRFIADMRKGVMAFDYGLQFVLNGYQYQLGEIATTTEQFSMEIPLLIALYDERNIFLPRKLTRKGITTFARMGFKPTFSLQAAKDKEIVRANEILREEVDTQFFNLLWSFAAGIVQNRKNGNTTFFEIGVNLGLLQRNKGQVEYIDNGSRSSESFSFANSGSYVSANMIYLFKFRPWRVNDKRPLPPVIYNPRFNQ